jgi:TolB protein
MRVTHQGAVCLSPNWWPDGSALVYTSFHDDYPDVYRIDLLNKRRTKLAGFPGLNTGADVSPDGRSMALILSKDGNPELYVMDLNSRRVTRLTRSPHAAEASPSWSPDGRQIVFVSDSSGSPQVYVVGRSGQAPVRISLRGRENVAPDWGPDGRIAYSSRQQGRYQIVVYDPASRKSVQLTNEYVDHEDPSWAPDGRHIVYVRTVRYHSDLYLLDTMGDASVRLTTLKGDWYSPACSAR